MPGRFFLSGVIALLGRKAIVVRDTRSPVPVPRPAALPPVDDNARRARAVARLILRRVGIAPLLPSLAILALTASPQRAAAQTSGAQSPVRATALATARATILPSSARIEQGALLVAQPGTSTALPPQSSRSVRGCDPAPDSATSACRLIVYNLP